MHAGAHNKVLGIGDHRSPGDNLDKRSSPEHHSVHNIRGLDHAPHIRAGDA